IAEPQVARRLVAARQIAERVFADSSLPLSARLRAGRLAGRHRAALALVAGKPRRDPAERAERARLLLATGSPDNIARAAAELRSDHDQQSPELAVARAELMLVQDGPGAAASIAALLRPAVTRPHPDPGALL